MENIILKNQKQLYSNLPSSQLGSKFTKLTNRFASKTNYPLQVKLPFKPQTTQQSLINTQSQQNIKNKLKHNRAQSQFQSSQLDYFKQINTKIKLQNQNLKQDLKFCNEKLSKIYQQKKALDYKLNICHKTINRSEKKINSLIELAHHLIVMVKDKLFDNNNNSQDINGLSKDSDINNKSNQQDKNVSPIQMKRKSMQRQILRIQQLSMNNKILNVNKKRSIQQMLNQSKQNKQTEESIRIRNGSFKRFNTIKKSTFYSRQNQIPSNNSSKSQYKDYIKQQHYNTKQAIQDNQSIKQQQNIKQIMSSLQIIQKDTKQLKVLQKLMQSISKTFTQQTLQMKQEQDQKKNNLFNNKNTSFIFNQIGNYFNHIIQNKTIQLHSNCKLHSKQYQQKIKPTYNSYRLYTNIKQIFDHQIYLLENQKMQFLQYKNKRLLKFIYQCSGCQRYQQMFNQIFRILRQGFKQIKSKVMPQLKTKQQNDLEILL